MAENEEITGKVAFDREGDNLAGTVRVSGNAADLLRQAATGPTEVTLKRPEIVQTHDQALWAAIRNRTGAIHFNRYAEFIDRLFCPHPDTEDLGRAVCSDFTSAPQAAQFGAPLVYERLNDLNRRPAIYGVDAYEQLKLATEAFLILESGLVVKPERDAMTGRHLRRKNDGSIVAWLPYENIIGTPDPQGKLGAEKVPGEDSRLNLAATFDTIMNNLKNYFGQRGTLPYLTRILDALLGPDLEKRTEKAPYCEGVLRQRLSCPSMLELIWSYWLEEGMLVQSMNAISLRFQNRLGIADRDPLAQLEIDPLRPLNNLLWGFIQDEQHRLTVVRRAYEYDHHYGLALYGKALPKLRSADSRSKFLEGFHNLLYRTAIFYREDADTTVISDGFPLLNALKEVHLSLAEGAHNQFGDLPWTARVETLIVQWLLARTEMREFLRGRAMVPYREPWMGQVDAMKKIQGWTDTTITHFHELAIFGEQILLSIRYGDWIDVNDQEQGKNWARYWKPEIQGYIHAYRAVTGVDLTNEPVDATPPWVHLKRQEERKRARRM